MLEPDLFTEGNLGLHYIETVSVNNWEVNRTVEPNYPRGDKDHHRKITRDILGHSLHGGSGGIKDQDQDNIEVV